MTSTTRVTAGVVAGVLSLAVTGAAAFAAFEPRDVTPSTVAVDTTTSPEPTQPVVPSPQPRARAMAARVKAILDQLVRKGTITRAQEDAIVQAFTDAAGGQAKSARKILASIVRRLMKASAGYLGLPPGQLRHQLAAGKTLGQIADATPGTSRDGLIAALTRDVDAKIDQLASSGTITADRAATLKAKVPDRLAKLVDRVFTPPGSGRGASPIPAT